MADTKITQLQPPQVGYPVVPATDVLPIVVIADPGMATSGSTRKVTVNQLLGAGGTATLASATITGDLTVDANSLYVNSSTNNVGLGTLTPSAASGRALEIYGGAGQSRIALKNDATGSASTDGSQIALVGSQLVIQNREASEITFETNNSERYRIASDGVATWSNVGGTSGTAMTLNSTGLGVGQPPTAKLDILGDPSSAANNTTTGALTKMRDIYTRFRANSAGISGDVYAAQLFQGAGSAFEIYNATSNPLVFGTAATERMRIDSSGNVGIGVTPSAWATYKAVSVGGIGASVFGLGSSQAGVAQGAFFNNGAGSGWAYSATSQVPTYYLQINGENIWNIASSGTAGAQITAWTPAMKLDASGNLILLSPSTPPTLATNGQLTVNATSNTNLRFSYRGSDGTTRVANITLA